MDIHNLCTFCDILETCPGGPVASALNPRYTFAHFVIGRSNDRATAIASAVAATPGRAYSPLFLHGNSGLGKTHLMQAVAHAARARNPAERISYLTAEQFTVELVAAVQDGHLDAFREHYRRAEILLMDDVHFLDSQREGGAREIFAELFDARYEAGVQVVVTSDRPPEAVGGLEMLAGQFRLGKVADISLPDAEHRAAILRSKVRAEGLADAMSEDVIVLVADAVRDNVRALEGALIRLLAYARLRGRPVTPALTREALRIDANAARRSRHSAALVRDLVAAEWGVTPEALISKRRSRELLEPRQVGMLLCREMLGMTLSSTGEAFGGRDHTTVLNSLARIDAARRRDPALDTRIQAMREALRTA